jgi:hypothetical protein
MAPNWFATLALMVWPLVAIGLYLNRPVGQATLWTILGAQLLLPVGASIKFEGVPQFDKISIPSLAALIGCLLVARRPLRIWTGFGFAGILVLMSLVVPFITAELNLDPVVLVDKILPAETHYDAVSAIVFQFISLLPFFLGRHVLRSSRDTAEILHVLVIAGLLYSLPMLFEIRMSPQLHKWIYGYFPSDFNQAVRDSGFRPMVFMGHGLLAAFFMMTTTVAAAAFWRTQVRIQRLPAAGVTAFLGTVLLLCKTLGALIYGCVLVPLVRFAKPRTQLRVALVLVTFSLAYPMLRFADFVPTRSIVDVATSISADRASSLKTRFDNEDQLLARASQRFFFGWGRWGRARVYEEETGKDVSITDGRWVITIGQFGLFGFFAEFGLLALPVFRAASALRFAESIHDRINLAALALILAINIVDLLPNSGLTPWTWLLTGALLGRTEALSIATRERVKSKSYSSALRSKSAA